MEKPIVKISLNGQSGNVYTIIGIIQKSLNDAGQKRQAKKFVEQAFAAKSYKNVLKLAEKYCTVKY